MILFLKNKAFEKVKISSIKLWANGSDIEGKRANRKAHHCRFFVDSDRKCEATQSREHDVKIYIKIISLVHADTYLQYVYVCIKR